MLMGRWIRRTPEDEATTWNAPALYTTKHPSEYLGDMAKFIEEHKYLFDHRSIDFFNDNIWDLLPPDWKVPLLSMTDGECILFPEGKYIPHNCPPSLLLFITKAHSLSMPRESVYPHSHHPQPRPKHRIDKDTFSLPALSLNMTPKKQHEVERLAALVTDVVQQVSASCVIDVGSGEGYLTQVLHHQLGLPVIAVDERSEFTEGAQQRARQISKERACMQRKGIAIGEVHNEVKHVVATISLDMPVSDFGELVGAVQTDRAVLVGLHTCGILANSMLQLFVGCSTQLAIVDLGCCYYRKMPDSEYMLMSNEGLNTGIHLSPGALKLACEAVHMIASKGEEEYRYSMSSHFYRTILETVLARRYPEGHKHRIRSLPRKKCASFEMYVQEATRKMLVTSGDVHDQRDLIQEMHNVYEDLKSEYPRVCALLLLRAVIAPVLESFILLDRWLYLNENGVSPALIPLFDASLSPRNIAIVAVKKPH